MIGRISVRGTARFIPVGSWWRKMGRALLDQRITEAELEVARAEKQYRFAVHRLDTLYQLRKEGRKRYGKKAKSRQRALSARANSKHTERRQQRITDAHRTQS